ncbi:MAG: dockerin type I domain-containing protein [Saprospiraceae bacterium]
MMREFKLVFITLLIMSECVLAQKQNNNWYFGTNAGLGFNNSTPTPLVGEMFALEGCASISDPGGHLLFYTNGMTVWNRNHIVMPNGNGLEGDEGSTQAGLIVPLPNSNSQYYVFTIDEYSKNGNLYYSIVDMNLNGGLGDIVIGSKNIIVVTRVAEQVTSVLHANGVDIWIVTHKTNSDKFLSYLLTSSGLDSLPVVSSIGSSHLAFELSGTIKASHGGSKIACSFTQQDFQYNVAELFDFNSATGILSNFYDLKLLITAERWVYGIEFSPNDSLLYLSTNVVGSYLYQIDLETKQLTTLSTNTGADYGALQLGPDNKLYMARYGFPFLDVIQQPNKTGAACQYEEAGIALATNTFSALGLPAFVPYSFFTDSTIVISLGNDTSICTGSSLILSVVLPANCDSTHFLWSDGSTAPELVVNQPGFYWVDIESSCIHFRDSIKITTLSCQAECGNISSTLYGNPERNERGYCLTSTPEKDGFYLGGFSDGKATITKMGLNGSVIWARSFDIVPGKADHIHSMLIDAEGMLAVSGTALTVNGSGSCFAMRYDPDYNLVSWVKEYANATQIENYSIIEKGKSGNYLISNYSDNHKAIRGFQILELDKQTGNIQSSAFFRPGLDNSVTKMVDIIYADNFIYGAGTSGLPTSDYRNLLVKLNGDHMDLAWSKSGHYALDTIADLRGCDLIMVNNEIYSCYYGHPPGSVKDKIYIQKTDLNGNLIWLKQYDIFKPRIVGFEMINSDNGIVVLGTQLSNLNEIVLFKVDYEGDVRWARKFRSGLFSRNILNNMDTRSSQLIEVGSNLLFTTYSIDALGKENMVLIKTDLNGESMLPCVDNLLLDLPWRTVDDPLFYPLALTSTSIDLKEITLFSTGMDFDLSPVESCVRVDTIHSTIDTSICNGEFVEGYDSTGIYKDIFTAMSGCDSVRILNLTVVPNSHSVLQVQICKGESFEGYDKSGIYPDTFPSSSGCDSIRTLRLNVISCSPIISFDLDACESVMANGSHMDYTEFIPSYPMVLPCADVSAQYLYRDPPQDNKHSCTPGINGSTAMCITTLNSCDYIPGSTASVVIEFTINPSVDSVVQLTGMLFYEKGPTTYNWINGPTGPNNYPKYYGIRILKNGTEIYRKEHILTTPVWTLQMYDFLNNDLFKVEGNAAFRIELLSYCPIGNGAEVSAWDLDEIKIYGGCVHSLPEKPVITGHVFTKTGKAVPHTIMSMADNSDFSEGIDKITDDTGYYIFDHFKESTNGFLKGYKNDDVLNGVSTLDIVRMQKHLLGIAPFTSLHQYIAADINRSGNVSAIDMLELRKVILGINTEFPGNTSWRFGSLPQNMTGTDISSFQEIKSLEYILHDTQIVDFVGIKIGDVNESILNPIRDDKVQWRNEKDLTLWTEGKQIKEDVPFTIGVKISSRVDIAGIQFALQLNDLSILNIKGERIPLSDENYSMNPDGIFRLSWSQPESVEIAEEDVLFSIQLISHHPGDLSDRIKLMKEILVPEVYLNNDPDIYKLNFEIGNTSVQNNDIAFFAVEPNPFQAMTNIHFSLANGGKTLIRLYDVSGRMIYAMNKTYTAGEHTEQIKTSDFLIGEGVLFCQLICNGDTRIVRVIKLY